jgi:hypothetical protein
MFFFIKKYLKYIKIAGIKLALLEKKIQCDSNYVTTYNIIMILLLNFFINFRLEIRMCIIHQNGSSIYKWSNSTSVSKTTAIIWKQPDLNKTLLFCRAKPTKHFAIRWTQCVECGYSLNDMNKSSSFVNCIYWFKKKHYDIVNMNSSHKFIEQIYQI